MLSFFFWFTILSTSLFMILIILMQRGRGGGLTGALGGAGGQSAFGAKAGDTFTRITIIVAIIWFTLCLLAIRIMNPAIHPVARTGPDTIEGAGALPDKEGDVDPAENVPGETGVTPVLPDANNDNADPGGAVEPGKSDASDVPVPEPDKNVPPSQAPGENPDGKTGEDGANPAPASEDKNNPADPPGEGEGSGGL